MKRCLGTYRRTVLVVDGRLHVQTFDGDFFVCFLFQFFALPNTVDICRSLENQLLVSMGFFQSIRSYFGVEWPVIWQLVFFWAICGCPKNLRSAVDRPTLAGCWQFFSV